MRYGRLIIGARRLVPSTGARRQVQIVFSRPAHPTRRISILAHVSVIYHIDYMQSTEQKNYTRLSTIKKDLSSEKKSKDPDLGRERRLRSPVDVFNIKQDCLYCEEEASVQKENPKGSKDSVIARALERGVSVADLVAAEAKYHKQCRLLYVSTGRERPEDECRILAFTKLCAYTDSAEDSQFLLSDLVETMNYFNTNNPNDSVCTAKYLKEKLNAQHGNSVFITELSGKSSIVNLKGSASSILHDKWYLDKKNMEEEENIRIVEVAADIIRRDIRSLVFDTKIYPAMESLDSGNLPETLKTFLNGVIQGEVVEKKNTALGEAIITPQADLLSNHHNKERLITLLSHYFETAGIEVCNSEGDADTLIVKRALELASVGNNATVVASDTDIVVMLLIRVTDDMELRVLSPEKIQESKDSVLFCHAITGCETTSAFFGKVFNSPESTKEEVCAAGEKFVIALYGGINVNSLDELKVIQYTRSIAKQPVTAAFELVT
ncbi:hypothetical protein PR048_018184 [Dryococelus australis]|uniref:Uncharacterized protein n=1 Tax=Dryococelus australis TaxID=614101 RepID=A0ABQ9HBM2_9NEOP|nr:hypothetical protein PR048_018184 [Dryococelus australis]